VYEIKGTFPQKKPYNISVSLNSALGADLLLVKGLEIGKELAEPAPDEAHNHWYSSNWFFGLLGLFAGIAIMYFLMKRGSRKVTTTTAILLLLFPTATSNRLSAHEGEHGAAKPNTGGPSNTFMVEKETQFLIGNDWSFA
jgi:ABC-type Fe3+-siderophore transport system permease subunit